MLSMATGSDNLFAANFFQQVLDEFPGQHDLNYSSWMFYSVPLIAIILVP